MIWVIAYNHETVRIGVQKRLEELARTDTLTGALNRLALQQDTASKIHCCAISHLLHFDVDWFKQVNDTYGHSAGDAVLKSLVKQVQILLPKSKIYRIGGEEFCVIFCAEHLEQAKKTSEKVRMSIEEQVIKSRESEIHITISGGLIALPTKCMSEQLDLALQKTDKALYRAKKSGRNTICLA
nr:GGDEF domain-containing protein [Vibrio sp. D420a]